MHLDHFSEIYQQGVRILENARSSPTLMSDQPIKEIEAEQADRAIVYRNGSSTTLSVEPFFDPDRIVAEARLSGIHPQPPGSSVKLEIIYREGEAVKAAPRHCGILPFKRPEHTARLALVYFCTPEEIKKRTEYAGKRSTKTHAFKDEISRPGSKAPGFSFRGRDYLLIYSALWAFNQTDFSKTGV